MLEKNEKQVNYIISKIYLTCSVAFVIMAICSHVGVFEFGKKYTMIVLVAGLIVSASPSIFIHFLSNNAIKYYMLFSAAVLIGILGTNNHIGIYITYILVPLCSCLYFEPVLVMKTSLFSYVIMIISIYINTADRYEVIYMGKTHMDIFVAFALGFTLEYVVVSVILYYLIKRANKIMEEKLSAIEQNKMKSRFLSSMSHEIRTPMNAILGMADVALRQDMNDEVRKSLKVIKSSSIGLLEIINDVLDLSKIEAGKLSIIMDTYSTKSLVDDVKAIVDARNINTKVPVYYHIQENMPKYLEGDEVRIKQVIFNYASNAIKYTESGQIDIYLECDTQKDGYVSLKCLVKDTGQGIKKEDMNKLFVMYSQLYAQKNHSKEGTGIGLAISKYFITHMNGSVDVESEYGKGSTFSFVVPQKVVDISDEDNANEHVTTDDEDIYSYVTNNAKILIVDDNEINREVVIAMLEPLHADIDEAKDGRVAVNMVKSTQYDLIFMDSHMPVLSGEEATMEIRKLEMYNLETVPIIALTADAIVGVRERLLACGMNDYIVKPVNIKILLDVVRRYLPKEKIKEKI